MSKYIGQIEFVGSSKLGRTTLVMEFGLMLDWFKSVVEFHKGEVMTGHYNGTEVVISVFEASNDGYSDRLLETVSIMNPYDLYNL